MSAERVVQCPLGHGPCPEDCLNHRGAKAVTDGLGDDFDPKQSRLKVIFADAFDHDINVLDIANVLARCSKEPEREG